MKVFFFCCWTRKWNCKNTWEWKKKKKIKKLWHTLSKWENATIEEIEHSERNQPAQVPEKKAKKKLSPV